MMRVMEVVHLKRTSRILAGHLWVFSNELSESPQKYEPGSLVELRDRHDAFLGIGSINPHSLIAVRILTHQKEPIDDGFFRKKILGAIDYRNRFFKEVESCRVVYSEADFLPGLIVDKYGDCLVVQILTLGMERWTDTVVGILEERFSPSVVVLRNDSSARLLEGLAREKKVLKGALDRLPEIKEDALVFQVDPASGQKTGFFLDQRENRIEFSRLVRGGKGVDLFCYTGAWSIHLARQGAHVTGVDNSEYAIIQAEKNRALNNLSASCEFRRAEVFAYLKEEVSEGNRYDFVVLDPPAFVKSKAKIREALRAYREANADGLRLLKSGGLLATSSCSYHVDKESFLEMLRSAARDAGKRVRLIAMRSQAKDHPVLLSMPETEYLKCAFLEVSGQS